MTTASDARRAGNPPDTRFNRPITVPRPRFEDASTPDLSARARRLRHARDCELPTHDLETWLAHHGPRMPDYPCVFRASAATVASELFARYRRPAAFLDDFGNISVHSEPGCAQAGGHLAYVVVAGIGRPRRVSSRLGRTWPLVELAARWDEAPTRGQYVSEFRCGSALCRRVLPLLDRLPRVFLQPVVSTNLLIGGPGSGLPFHRHEQTWQLQLLGRKVWFLLPPGRPATALAEVACPGVDTGSTRRLFSLRPLPLFLCAAQGSHI